MQGKWLISLFLLVQAAAPAFSQECVTGLVSNSILSSEQQRPVLKGAAAGSLSLPFSDDFSDSHPYPSEERWTDRVVYVNNTFSNRQHTQGVATFDCLNENGELYDFVSLAVFKADTLTSVPINLAYPASDSICLSFSYEAGGLADMPEQDDSLTLSFWSPSEMRWYSMWQARGDTTDGFVSVTIPVKEARFLADGFRLRFTGHASLSGIQTEPSRAGNADLWNVDDILLDRNRSVTDTVLHDVALTLPLRSLVKEYEAMPWKHFRQSFLSMMSPSAGMDYRNNDTIIRNVTRHISILDMATGLTVRDFNAGATNVDPLTDIHFDAPLLYTYNTSPADTAVFSVSSWLITDDFDPKSNDTLTFTQKFLDYFAIDDGSAEAGYGINGQGSRNAMAALRFRSYIADSVRAVSICFSDAYNNANQRAFDIMVWADDNGRPGALLGRTEGPVASPAGTLNGFTTYLFEKPVSVFGNFWVGWGQLSETFLNAGLDLNTMPAGRQYYMISGEWYQSQVKGTVMIRPVMKGQGTQTHTEVPGEGARMFKLFPNPTHGPSTLKISDNAPENFTLEVYSVKGEKVLSVPRTESPDFSSLAAGSYFVVVTSDTGAALAVLRLIKIN